ncbi:helix-turn-helix transcriptional regulator [Tessaracoccus sp. G1721]
MTSEHHGLGPTRTRVLGLLQSASAPVSVADVADQLGLHRNSARFHLEGLRDAGYAVSAAAPVGQAGRPPLLFAATSDSPNVSNSHLMELTEVLIQNFVTPLPDGTRLAEAAGRSWGVSMVDEEGEPRDPVDGLVDHLAERGFGTVAVGTDLTFTRCPFRAEVGLQELPVVCAIHQGFVDGYLEATGSPLKAGRIAVGPRLCHLALHSPAGADGPGRGTAPAG